ncbi:MAG: membrane protein insertion efficiency factor YidD [Desulfomicrobium sp.]|uniref:Putative membrane protein insertion efficiency factor n=1 Tax=Desulfomicrobium baculatum (strain DSM 4028 / VKM B-1378 / X) TaxID=525897 RepID=C7LXJ5_DESBD|nr:membrane protein insertion efficiency factor YidD [Desulfomicrobium baculatum]ACU91231.1 protein of unknown function DUF37 [Desulfomicrobium baculatum DSM 4028]MBP9943604.1 membrane protein insertion efficiency factor YidD [Desulfomicrobium sp.]HML49644.1 membrane protein insertion efficiency factor YidD [Clostridia bacterium]
MRHVFVRILSLYQYLISPLYSPCCRFTPSCSEYARQAVLSHGIFRGMGLAFWRLLRCHPLCAGGYDPVPTPNLSKRD